MADTTHRRLRVAATPLLAGAAVLGAAGHAMAVGSPSATRVTAALGAADPLTGLRDVLSDPNIAFLLFIIGALGLATELIHPNLLTGILGSVALILAFVGFGNLPVNVAGLLLIILGFVLFVLETQIVSHGLLALGGIVCVALGASALYTAPASGGTPAVQVAPGVLVVTTGTLAVLMGLLSFFALRTRRMKAPKDQLGRPVPIGTEGVVQAPLEPVGTVFLSGETWSARTPDERLLARETSVRLLGFDGLIALVEPIGGVPAGTAPPPAPPAASAPPAPRDPPAIPAGGRP
jgi:membrane-bound serine protease (ClpP class)